MIGRYERPGRLHVQQRDISWSCIKRCNSDADIQAASTCDPGSPWSRLSSISSPGAISPAGRRCFGSEAIVSHSGDLPVLQKCPSTPSLFFGCYPEHADHESDALEAFGQLFPGLHGEKASPQSAKRHRREPGGPELEPEAAALESSETQSAATAEPDATPAEPQLAQNDNGSADSAGREAIVFDLLADEQGEPMLVPVGGDKASPSRLVRDLHEDELVTLRVFRFFEDQTDHKHKWEKELHNVNSGSLTWVPVQLEPSMHSKAGSKYGKWFMVHSVQAYARHLKSGYYMAASGICVPASKFGTSPAIRRLVSGKLLSGGYFWHVSPTTQAEMGEEHLVAHGWRHVTNAGPFDGDKFLEEWRKDGSPMHGRGLQAALDRIA